MIDKLINFTKLLKSKDVSLLKIRPGAKYIAVINSAAFQISEGQSLGDAIPEIQTIIFVEGNPDESLALYEVQE